MITDPITTLHFKYVIPINYKIFLIVYLSDISILHYLSLENVHISLIDTDKTSL